MFFVECLFVTHHVFLFLSLFICPKDTVRCGDNASPHDVIEVVISGEKQKNPAGDLKSPAGVGVGAFGVS
jgi:hypothetical protein